MKLVQVRFPGQGRSETFLLGDRSYSYGDKVLAQSERGITLGYISSFPYTDPKIDSSTLKTIKRLATVKDEEEAINLHQKQKKTQFLCEKIAQDLKLDITLTHALFTDFNKKIIFYFLAPQKIDFRELLKKLAQELKKSIELRHISQRDRSSALGGIGPCGLELCCSSFLKKYGHVAIKTVKNQQLSLADSKANGVCGVLKCCLNYENDFYTEQHQKAPPLGSLIATQSGFKGRVEKINLLEGTFELLTPPNILKKCYFEDFKEVISAEQVNFDGPVTKDQEVILGMKKNSFPKSIEEETSIFIENYFREEDSP